MVDGFSLYMSTRRWCFDKRVCK